mgnify:FL=1
MYIVIRKSKQYMQTFISETLDDILKSNSTFDNCVFIVPSQRAGVFIKNSFKNKISQGFLPEIFTIERFTEKISEIKKGDTIQLLFHFYKIYCELEENPDSFDIFSSWAFVVLQDFNEVDQYLVDSNDLFLYLRDIQRMKKWSVKGEFKETELIKDHFFFMERLGKYYTKFYKFLVENKTGYQGLVYREATKKVSSFLNEHSQKKFFFIGFNALNKSEEYLFQEFLLTNRTEIYWDIDLAFFESNHTAGSFIRKYKNEWKYYENNDIKLIGDNFSKSKNIEVIGVPKNIAQLKYAGEILQSFESYENAALVLGDESLLSVALNSIPKKVNAINITMGYPLQNVPTSHFVTSIFQLFATQDKLQKTASNEFYYKDVLGFFKNPLVYQLVNNYNQHIILNIQEAISKENRSFLSYETIQSYLSSLDESISSILLSVFKPFQNVEDFINRILDIIEHIRDDISTLEKEYLFRFYTAFVQLKTLNNSHGYFQSIKTLFQFYKKIVVAEKLSFQGEPLKGLQLMGMLETRVLDFENVVITSVNENVIPSNSTQNSFIPFDIKLQFGLPTYKEKDAIFSYHFFRLIQRAKNIYLLYNTENDSFGNGEKSRFISQLELIRSDVNSKFVGQKVITEKRVLKEIQKDTLIIEKLTSLAQKGISPSVITNYLYNPIAFYKQKVLGINELDTVEETVAANTLGTVVHDTLEELYFPFINQYLTIENVDSMLRKSKELVQKYFKKHFRNGEIDRGKNRLIFEVANRHVERFLALEKNVLKENNQLKILATEQKLETTIVIPRLDFPVKIKGIVDRIDELNGVIRIIDYKTGMVNSSDLKITDFSTIQDYKYSKAIQVLLYSLLYIKNTKSNIFPSIEAGIYSFKNLKSGLLKVNFSSNYRNPDYMITSEKLEESIIEIGKIIEEIYNPVISFKEPEELPF